MGAQERKRQKRIREYVINRDGMSCCYCNKNLTLETITMEHIVPHSKRGTFNATNLTVACAACNSGRGSKPFFEFCKKFNFPDSKLQKYKSLYFDNLRIKVLNIAKEECLTDDIAIPQDIIHQACQVLKIKDISFADYEKKYAFEISFHQSCHRKNIKFCFEQLIRFIESENN